MPKLQDKDAIVCFQPTFYFMAVFMEELGRNPTQQMHTYCRWYKNLFCCLYLTDREVQTHRTRSIQLKQNCTCLFLLVPLFSPSYYKAIKKKDLLHYVSRCTPSLTCWMFFKASFIITEPCNLKFLVTVSKNFPTREAILISCDNSTKFFFRGNLC